MSKKLKLKKDKTRENKKDKTDIVPVQRLNKMLAVILRTDKSVKFKWVDFKSERFRCGTHTYFKDNTGTYLSENKIRCAVFLEGVAIPIHHGQLDIKTEKRTYIDPYTEEEEEIEVQLINNLKFDTEIIDICLNRGFADEFTKKKMDATGMAVIVLLILGIGVGIANFYVSYMSGAIQ